MNVTVDLVAELVGVGEIVRLEVLETERVAERRLNQPAAAATDHVRADDVGVDGEVPLGIVDTTGEGVESCG